MSPLSPQQIAKLQCSKPPKQAPRPEYDNKLDEALFGMFGRRWDELEQFQREAKHLFHVLNWTTLLWNNTRAEDVPLLCSLAQQTANTTLRKKACICLRSYLADSSVDRGMSLKSNVKQTLEALGEPIGVVYTPRTIPHQE